MNQEVFHSDYLEDSQYLEYFINTTLTTDTLHVPFQKKKYNPSMYLFKCSVKLAVRNILQKLISHKASNGTLIIHQKLEDDSLIGKDVEEDLDILIKEAGLDYNGESQSLPQDGSKSVEGLTKQYRKGNEVKCQYCYVYTQYMIEVCKCCLENACYTCFIKRNMTTIINSVNSLLIVNKRICEYKLLEYLKSIIQCNICKDTGKFKSYINTYIETYDTCIINKYDKLHDINFYAIENTQLSSHILDLDKYIKKYKISIGNILEYGYFIEFENDMLTIKLNVETVKQLLHNVKHKSHITCDVIKVNVKYTTYFVLDVIYNKCIIYGTKRLKNIYSKGINSSKPGKNINEGVATIPNDPNYVQPTLNSKNPTQSGHDFSESGVSIEIELGDSNPVQTVEPEISQEQGMLFIHGWNQFCYTMNKLLSLYMHEGGTKYALVQVLIDNINDIPLK
jgi:hypothetical protein